MRGPIRVFSGFPCHFDADLAAYATLDTKQLISYTRTPLIDMIASLHDSCGE